MYLEIKIFLTVAKILFEIYLLFTDIYSNHFLFNENKFSTLKFYRVQYQGILIWQPRINSKERFKKRKALGIKMNSVNICGPGYKQI